MAVITISRQYGSGGDEIAEEICSTTGYSLFDKRILARAASQAGLSDQEIIECSEENYKCLNFLDRLFGRPHLVTQARVWKEDRDGVRTREEIQLGEEITLPLITRAVQSAYEKDNIVIVGRGGQVILQDRPGVLHVRVEAPLEERILRVREYPMLAKQTYSDSVEARRAAQNLIETNDSASADFLRRVYNVDWADPMMYHLVINTAKLDVYRATKLIIATIQEMESLPIR